MGLTLRGPHRRTHSSAAGTLRSPAPPGQQRLSTVEVSRSASDSARLEIDSMWASICGAPRPTRHGAMRFGAASGGLGNARDALLIERHLPCDLVVRDAFDLT